MQRDDSPYWRVLGPEPAQVKTFRNPPIHPTQLADLPVVACGAQLEEICRIFGVTTTALAEFVEELRERVRLYSQYLKYCKT